MESPAGDLTATFNADPDIVPAALAGREVRISLQPDETVDGRQGEATYIEALQLPHVIVCDGHLWATQRKVLARVGGPGEVGTDYYAYYSGLDVFASVFYPEGNDISKTARSRLMSSGRYKALRWTARGAFEPVYDSAASTSLDALVEAIRDCARFRARVDLAGGYSQIHPVVYPFYYPDDDAMVVETEMQYFPDFMRVGRSTLLEQLGERAAIFRDYRDPENREKGLTLRTNTFSGFYRLQREGVGKRLYDLGRERQQHFERVIVFAEP